MTRHSHAGAKGPAIGLWERSGAILKAFCCSPPGARCCCEADLNGSWKAADRSVGSAGAVGSQRSSDPHQQRGRRSGGISESISQATETAREYAADVGKTVGDKAGAYASAVGDKAGAYASAVGEYADDAWRKSERAGRASAEHSAGIDKPFVARTAACFGGCRVGRRRGWWPQHSQLPQSSAAPWARQVSDCPKRPAAPVSR